MTESKVLNILLVDDDEIDVKNVKRAFAKNHIINPLFTAHNGLEALDVLRGTGAQAMPQDRRLVLLDLNMPKMNGLEFLREIRQDADLRCLTVIVLTTSANERDRVEAYNFNVAGYIVKPVTFVAVVEAMTALNKYWSINELL